MAVSKQPCITPETSSGEGLDEEPSSRGEAKWKRFHPFRVVRKIFRRRVKRDGTAEVSDASKKSWSTSELQSVQEDSSGKCEVTSPLKIGLSVSHDSIFSPEGSTNVNGEELNVPRGSSLSVCHTSVKNMFKDELFTRVRARRDSDDDDDVGLPHSPCTSPTTVDVLTQGLKDKTFKLQTTYSAGSLVSMESSENDEDSAGFSSGHSSRLSLLDKRSAESEGDPDLCHHIPLNHNAAHHKIAIRPKRTYGLPRRRMNQLAAAKKSTLSSTPEVSEENNQLFLKFELTETVKTVSDFTEENATEMVSTSLQSTDCRTSIQSVSSNFGNVATSVHETQMHQTNKISILEDSQTTKVEKTLLERKGMQQSNSSDFRLETCSSNSIVDVMDDNEIHRSRFPELGEIANKDTNSSFEDFRQGFMNNSPEPQMESVRLMKTSLQDIIKKEIGTKEDVLAQQEASLKVSSLVKNIERSDSFKSTEVTSKRQEEQCTQYLSDKKLTNDYMNLKDTEKSINNSLDNSLKTVKNADYISIAQNIAEEKSSSTAAFSSDKHSECSKEFICEAMKKSTSVTERLDADSEFIFKPVGVRKDPKLEGDSENLLKKGKVPEKSSEHTLSSSSFPEEESIMSDKSLSLGMEESRVFVSHQVSYSNNRTDMLVTETHNIAAVNDKRAVSVKSPLDKSPENKMERNNEPWISSVGISSKKTVTDVTVNSSTSNFCDEKMIEDTVTISVNSMSESLKSMPGVNLEENIVVTPKSNRSSLPSKPPTNSKSSHKDRSQAKSPHGSHLPDVVSSNSKSANTPKRVSVEIVPFNQRMKERKYQSQPNSNKGTSPDTVKRNSNSSLERKYSGKDSSPDVIKRNPTVSVERKLSDRKVTTRNKDSDKSNNRHSFSGAVTTSTVKKDTEAATEKVVKAEKLQYPVQIRVQKSPKPDTREKGNTDSKNTKDLKRINNDVKFHMQSSKTDVKYVKEREKDVQENPPKWEIKIQPTSQNHSSNLTDMEENGSLSFQNSLKKGNDIKSVQPFHDVPKPVDNHEPSLNQPLDSPPMKNKDNSWKSPKDTPPPSDDPEPELMRVFARRSIKQKHCDKDKTGDKEDNIAADLPSDESLPFETTDTYEMESCNQMISISQNSTVIKISESPKPHITKPDLIKKKSKSFSEKEKVIPRSASPLKEMNLIRRESPTKLTNSDSLYNETVHPRQRLASVPDLPINLPPDIEKRNSLRGSQNGSAENTPTPSLKDEHLHRASSISVPSPTSMLNGSLGMVKDSQEIMNGKEPHTPAWLQLAQQRRELREQRERLLLGSSTNSFLDASSKPSRSSKVWDMVNNFQKLQMT